jgi:3-hydroxyisobutyrate dehydrogenase
MTAARKAKTVGFVGLGAMGAPMVKNILAAGLPVVVYDLDSSKTERLAAFGAEVGACPADVARRAHVLISMVDTTQQALDVIVGRNGFIDGAEAGDVVVSMGTIDPEAVRKMHATLAATGVDIIDAPVTGMIAGAESGALKAYVGGALSALETARPALASMTSEIRHIGGLGQGIIIKLVNNMLAQAGRVLVVEAMVLGAKAGIDPETIIDVVTSTSGNSVVFETSAPRMLSRDFTGIRMDITIKDLELETQLGKSLGVPMFMAAVAQQVYQMGKAAGLGNEDPTAIVKVYEQLTGISLAKV